MIETRPATASDIDAVAEIERESFSDAWSAASFRSLLGQPATSFTVAEEGGALVGYSVVVWALEEADVANLAVRPSARGRGIGAALLDAALRDAVERGTERMFLEVRDSNAAALALYRTRGFTEVARRKRYYRRPIEDAIVMLRTFRA